MTTDIEVFLVSDDTAAEATISHVESFFHTVEARFSRFLDDSELSRLNRAPANVVEVSADLAELLRMALEAAAASNGLFDPTTIGALEAAGYDRSFELIASLPAGVRLNNLPHAGSAWRGIDVDCERGLLTRPAGVRIDLGGIAKGWAVDRAAALLQPLGAGAVNAGGDLCAWGDEPEAAAGAGWLVAVEDPARPDRDLAWLSLQNRAMATSSIMRRRWAGGHHLIDPRSGRPAETDLHSVTAVAATAGQAEVAAKVALILGRDAGLIWLAQQPAVDALLVAADGSTYGTPGINEMVVTG